MLCNCDWVLRIITGGLLSNVWALRKDMGKSHLSAAASA